MKRDVVFIDKAILNTNLVSLLTKTVSIIFYYPMLLTMTVLVIYFYDCLSYFDKEAL